MYILGIETSCDETAASVVKDGKTILSNVVVSQIDIFKEYGGVIPEVAARNHLEVMLPVVHEAIRQAEKNDKQFYARNRAFERKNHTQEERERGECVPSLKGIDAIAVTHTPGLIGSLLIGTLTARTLAILHNKPLYAVHHLKSHIYANWLSNQNPEFPLLALVVSGGHTQIIRMTAHNKFEIIGTTRDDAVGECFDKVAKILGLPYPGGPSISKAAKDGDPHKYHFPHPRLSSPNRGETKYSDLDFSFSGLKTAVLREVQKAVKKPISFPSHELKNLLTKEQVNDFAASFENTATDILLENLNKALEKYPDTKSICIAGGVSANELLRTKLGTAEDNFSNDKEISLFEKLSSAVPVYVPNKSLTGDNGAMVAAAAFYEIKEGVKPTDHYTLNIYPRKPIS
ncbi:tRNA (adenosine(37)-N6)-threonylcarbamoyltransferase complex transferase subunit TsaD [Candidatus Saccharibacteria bacterium]|nr:tRNA (adenosine(37)-N6)-threonylcarbamoyltransferase complex transferase subunit TsaD [Candidatus Saccharibacteria bacterium]